jgi:uncharacterized protein (TIGR00369 family)
MAEHEAPLGTLRKQPNSLHCFACGVDNASGLQIHFYDNAEDEVHAHYTVPERFQGYPGMVHGGILATILDELVGRAVMARDPTQFMVSAKLTVRYRKPVPTEQLLVLFGKVLRRRGRIATAKAEVRLVDGTLCVEAEGTLVHLDAFDVYADQLDELGWKVYPENTESDARGVEYDTA